MSHTVSFRGTTFYDATAGTSAVNGGAAGMLSVSPRVREVIARGFPLGVGYVLKSGNTGPAVHEFGGTWRTNDLSGTLAMLNGLTGLPTGTLSDSIWGNFGNCVLREVRRLGEPRKLDDAWAWLVEARLTFDQYP